MSKKPNAWVSFIKKWSVKNGLTYGCSISDPRAKAEYQAQKPVKVVKAKSIKSTKLNKAENIENIENINALDFIKKQPKKKIDVVFPYKKFREEIETYDKENYSKALKGDINQDKYFSFMKAKLRILDKIKYPSNVVEHPALIKILKHNIKKLTEFAQSKVKLSKPYVEPKIKKSKPLKPLADALATLVKKQTKEGKKKGKKIIIDNWTSSVLPDLFKEYDPETFEKIKMWVEKKMFNKYIAVNLVIRFFKSYNVELLNLYSVPIYLDGIEKILNYIVELSRKSPMHSAEVRNPIRVGDIRKIQGLGKQKEKLFEWAKLNEKYK